MHAQAQQTYQLGLDSLAIRADVAALNVAGPRKHPAHPEDRYRIAYSLILGYVYEGVLPSPSAQAPAHIEPPHIESVVELLGGRQTDMRMTRAGVGSSNLALRISCGHCESRAALARSRTGRSRNIDERSRRVRQ